VIGKRIITKSEEDEEVDLNEKFLPDELTGIP